MNIYDEIFAICSNNKARKTVFYNWFFVWMNEKLQMQFLKMKLDFCIKI